MSADAIAPAATTRRQIAAICRFIRSPPSSVSDARGAPAANRASHVPPEYSQRLSKVPFIFCILVTLALGHAFRAVRWSFVDTSVNLSAAADTRSWHELVSDSLTKSVDYRP